MALTVTGKIEQILEPQSGVSRAGNEWKKQEFVIETNEQFPRKVCFTLFGDKISMVDGLKPGQDVEVSFNVESREYNGKWFHNINAWKIEQPSEGQIPEPPQFSNDDIPPEPADDGTNDLPF
jgi:hypothetical protein